eukprot:7052656-Pyramimonas_sp.AAC.1
MGYSSSNRDRTWDVRAQVESMGCECSQLDLKWDVNDRTELEHGMFEFESRFRDVRAQLEI